MKIKNFRPYITGKEITYIKDILDNRYDMSGDGVYTKKVHAFLEKRYKTKKALLTTSGTTALEFAVRLLNLKPGDEIIVPSFTFSSTANAVLLSFGLKVVFADIDRDTLNIDPKDIERKITKNTKAIIVVHYAGVACDMNYIMNIARRNNLKVIEDAAQGIEAKYKGKFLGTIGDFGCISFHDTKNITSGEGGALFINTSDLNIIERAEIVREKGTNRTKFFRGEVDKYTWVDVGSSYLPSDILAAFLLAQLEEVEKITGLRLKVYEEYKKRLSPLEKKGRIKLPTIPKYAKHNAHIFYVILKSEEERDFVMNYLRGKGISAPFHYIPLHSSPLGMGLGYSPKDVPVTEDLSYRLIRLPMFADMTMKEINYVTKHLEIALNQLSKNKPKVTIGIAAYNEENNIKKVLETLLRQKQLNWSLEKIIVACGGCTDNTIEYARSIKSDKIQVIVNENREGKAVDEQKIIDIFDSDYLVMFDADVSLADDMVIENLISMFNKDTSISLVGGNPRPFTPRSFFENAVYSTFQVLDKSRKFVKDGNNIYGCSGQCLAMTKKFAKTIAFPPNIIAEDDYIYFSCISSGRKFRYCEKAVVYYNLPKKISDYLKQVFRADPDAAVRNVDKYFGQLAADEYHRPFIPYAKAVMNSFIKNPLGSILMISIRLFSKPIGPIIAKNYKIGWFTANSTK